MNNPFVILLLCFFWTPLLFGVTEAPKRRGVDKTKEVNVQQVEKDAQVKKAPSFEIQTTSPKNKKLTVRYYVPKGYNDKLNVSYRVLVFFSGRNMTGEHEILDPKWSNWCDQNNIFMVVPHYIDDDYWEPRKWSGKALLDALAQLKKQYKICDEKLLFYGYSAGGQCANLFPAWMPQRSRAWVAHATGILHRPDQRMKDVAGLLTCGDADQHRFILSRQFRDAYKKLGISILWKSFPNRPHDVPGGSVYLAQAFLAYYHKLYLNDLTSQAKPGKLPTALVAVADDLDNSVFKPNDPQVESIQPEDRVYFTVPALAEAWEKSGTMR